MSVLDTLVADLETAKAKVVALVNGPIVHDIEAALLPNLASQLPAIESLISDVLKATLADQVDSYDPATVAEDVKNFAKAATAKVQNKHTTTPATTPKTGV